jgi:ribosomal protein S18 acetylase RimI-like enzyme
MARPVEGLARPPHVPGLELEPYRNAWAEQFSIAEAMAMEGLAAFREMGQPTGYAQAEGFDAFCVASEGGNLVGFGQAMVPEGWINWLGVIPDARRRGVGRHIVAELGRQVREARGTHLAALVELDTPGQAFLAALGFRERGTRKTLMIRRGAEG